MYSLILSVAELNRRGQNGIVHVILLLNTNRIGHRRLPGNAAVSIGTVIGQSVEPGIICPAVNARQMMTGSRACNAANRL